MPASPDTATTTTTRSRRCGPWRLARTTIHRARDLDLATHAMALAAEQVLSTVPLLLALSALLRHVHLGRAERLIADVVQLDPDAYAALSTLIRTTGSLTLGDGWVELAIAAAFLTGVASTTQQVLQLIWGIQVERRVKLRCQLLWVVCCVPALAAAMVVGRSVHRAMHGAAVGSWLAALVEGTSALLFFWWSQRILLASSIPWRDLLPGSVLTGIGSAVLTVLSAHFLGDQVIEQTNFYGPIGAAMVLSLWLMTACFVVVGSALLGAVWVQQRQPEALPHP